MSRKEFFLTNFKKSKKFRTFTSLHNSLRFCFHMQSVHNRDDYVKIRTENIVEEKQTNFNKYSSRRVTNYTFIFRLLQFNALQLEVILEKWTTNYCTSCEPIGFKMLLRDYIYLYFLVIESCDWTTLRAQLS